MIFTLARCRSIRAREIVEKLICCQFQLCGVIVNENRNENRLAQTIVVAESIISSTIHNQRVIQIEIPAELS